MSETISVLSPLNGWLFPLADADDPVFAGGLAGDGVLIEPLDGEVRAPIEGEVVVLAATRHAVAVRSANGAEVLVHVGLETVALKGRGFIANVPVGRKVGAGDRLLDVDLEAVADGARSLATPVIVTNGDDFLVSWRHPGGRVAVGEVIFTIERRSMLVGGHGGTWIGRDAVIGWPHGVHARPAARLAGLLEGYQAEVALVANGRRAGVRSVLSAMALGLPHGAAVRVEARGPDAGEALGAAVAALADPALDPQADTPASAPATRGERTRASQLPGVRASAGLSIGPVVQLRPQTWDAPPHTGDAELEARRFTTAHAQAVRDIELCAKSARGFQSDIAHAQAALMRDADLLDDTRAAMVSGLSAGVAWRQALADRARALRATGDARLIERVADLDDLDRLLISHLPGAQAPADKVLPVGAILVAPDVSPALLSSTGASGLAGICTAGGGPTSHAAIIAASLGLPMLTAVGPAVLDVEDGTVVALDADGGFLDLSPDVMATRAIMDQRAADRRAALDAAQTLCTTSDGHRVEVLANLGAATEAAAAVQAGGEGCGLLRTEFLFMERSAPPSVADQLNSLQAIADALAGRPLTIRTLDIGSDKPAAWAHLPAASNPALGLRGVRVSLAQPDLFRLQLEAVVRLRSSGHVRLMLPMVSDLSDLRAARAILEEVAREHGVTAPSLGVMIETPSAAVLADQLADEADFFSIGTNDLTQYALAMDRTHPDLAARLDAAHPAVLRLVRMVVEGASRRGRPVAVCGALASEPYGAALLVGLGVTELSCAPSRIPDIKRTLRAQSLSALRAMADASLKLDSADAVRALAAETLA